MPTLSVIVPVYNTKKYLKQCIDSIIDQSYKDLEIIIVDDGSLDGAGDVCDKYKKIDSRIRVFHKKNEGLISTRYTGVINAVGKYIGFVDSDDWIARDMYEELISVAKKEQCDIVSMGYTSVSEDWMREEDDATLFGIFEKGKNLDILLSNMMYDAHSQRRGIHSSLCCKVIVRDLLLDAITKVDKNISLGEDAAIFYPCCLNAERISIIKGYKYYYRFRSNSMCHHFSTDTFEKIYRFNQYMKKVFAEYGDQYNIQEQLKMYNWDFIYLILKQVFGLDVYAYISAIFPRDAVEKGSNVILYGAGKVGESYYRQILESNYCNIIAWADKNNDGTGDIIDPVQIRNLEYSKIIIAVYSKVLAEEIRDELIELGINKEKIVWAEPQNRPQISVKVR